jgi:RNA exonuclease 1
MLEKVSTRIEDIQAHLLSLIQESDIIVGHSLENDMKAIRMVHLNIVDTSIIFRGGSGRKYG